MSYQDITTGAEAEKWQVDEATATLGKEDSFVPVSIRILKEEETQDEKLGILFSTVSAIVTAVISITSAIIGGVQRKKMREAEQKRADNLKEVQNYLIQLVGAYNLRMKENRLRLTAISKKLSGLGKLSINEKKAYWVLNGGIVQNGYSEMIPVNDFSLSGDTRENMKVFQGVSGAGLKPLQFSKGSVNRECENIHRVNAVSHGIIDKARNTIEKWKKEHPDAKSMQVSAMGRSVMGIAQKKYIKEVTDRWQFFSNQCELYGVKIIWNCKKSILVNSSENSTFENFLNLSTKVSKSSKLEIVKNIKPLILYKNQTINDFWAVRGGWGSSNDVWVKTKEWLGGTSNYHLATAFLRPNGVFNGRTICKVTNDGRLDWDTHLDTKHDNQLSVYEVGKKLQSYSDDCREKFNWSQLAGVPYWCIYAYMTSQASSKSGYNQAEDDTEFLKAQVEALAVARKIEREDTTKDTPSNDGGKIPNRDTSANNRALNVAQKKTDAEKKSIVGKLKKFWRSDENQKKTKIGVGLGIGAYLIGRK